MDMWIAGYWGIGVAQPRVAWRLPGRVGFVAGTVISGVSACSAVGGPFLTVPLMRCCNVPMVQAVGTAGAIGLPIALVGMLVWLVMVGDRGMISNKAIDEMRDSQGIAWITALKSVSIRALVEQGQLQLDLFDERNLLELNSPDYPGERLVACRNPELAKLRTHKREELLAATDANLQKIKARVDAGKLAGRDEIGLRVGKVINQYKVAKHFALAIGDNTFTFARKLEGIAGEAALDGIYIIRTSVSAVQMDAPQCVRNYKALANVERAFRSLKTIDLKVRPIHHRTADRVRAHSLLCMLSYYVEWHMREAWAPLMFADTDNQAKATRDPVAPAKRSKAALAMKLEC